MRSRCKGWQIRLVLPPLPCLAPARLLLHRCAPPRRVSGSHLKTKLLLCVVLRANPGLKIDTRIGYKSATQGADRDLGFCSNTSVQAHTPGIYCNGSVTSCVRVQPGVCLAQ